MSEISELLRARIRGERQAFRRVLELVYRDMRRMAHMRLQRTRPSDRLGTTSLVHDAVLRMVKHDGLHVSDRRALFAYIAHTLRSVMVDHARRHHSLKRGGQHQFVSWSTTVEGHRIEPARLRALDQALKSLEESDPVLHRLAELRYFGGMSFAEIAALDGTSERTVQREWRRARSRLREALATQRDTA